MLDVKQTKTSTHQMIRLLNTNIEGRVQILKALTTIKGIGDRFAHSIIKKSEIPFSKRAGELTQEEQDKISEIISNPDKFGIPIWTFNHQKDFTTGKSSHLIGNEVETNLRFLIERGKKNKHIRQFRLSLGLKVRGQRTKSNGRHGSTLGVSRKKK